MHRLIVQNKHFLVKKILWKPNSKTPFHNHDKDCTFMVIRGKIREESFDQQKLIYRLLKQGDVAHHDKKKIHKCSSLGYSETLHIYGSLPKNILYMDQNISYS